MSKLNIIFNGTDYSIDEAALASAKDSLKTHLSTVMNGSGGGLATITWDGVVGDRVFIEQDDGTIHVKVSDNPVTIDDLVGATVTLTVNDSTYNSTIDRESIYDFGGIAVTASVIAVFAADNAMSLEPGVYFLWNEDGYISSLTFPSTSSAGSTIITLDGTSYQVDPTKLQVATDNFVAHISTLTGGGLEPITWDGVVGDRVTVSVPDASYIFVKVSDVVLSADDLVGATCCVYGGSTAVITADMLTDVPGGVLLPEGLAISVSDAAAFSEAMSVTFPETGMYFYVDVGRDMYIESITFAGGSTGGDTKLIINGTEYLIDSAKLSDAIDDLHEALGRLSV